MIFLIMIRIYKKRSADSFCSCWRSFFDILW